MATRHTRQSSFYFASRGHGANVTEYDAIPRGATVTEFYSRPVMEGKLPVEGYDGLYQNSSSSSKDGKTYMKQKVAPRDPGLDPPIGSLVLMRKVPLKADPKAYFAAERTFLLWLHTSLWLLSASIGIMAYAKDDPIKFMYGAFIFPVAVCFIVYSMFQCRFINYGHCRFSSEKNV